MTDITRLLDSASDQSVRDVLGAGLDDAPSPEALDKVAGTLGMSAAALSTSSSALALPSSASVNPGSIGVASFGASAKVGVLAGAATPAGVAGTQSGLAGAGIGVGAWLKTLMVSFISAGALSTGAIVVHERLDQNEGAPHRAPTASLERGDMPVSSTSRAAVSRPVAAPSVSERAAENAPAAPPLRAAEPEGTGAEGSPPRPPNPRVGQRSAQTISNSEREGSLALDVARIDSARSALEANDAKRALRELDAYERSPRAGVLDREALLLRIDALARQGAMAEMRALARQYLQRFPEDAHVPRVRQLLGARPSNVQAFPSP